MLAFEFGGRLSVYGTQYAPQHLTWETQAASGSSTHWISSDTHSQSFLSSLFVLSGTRSLSRRLRRRSRSCSVSYDLFVRYFIIIIFIICRVFETLYLFLPLRIQFLFLPRHFCLYFCLFLPVCVGGELPRECKSVGLYTTY